jgi:predicted nuclease of predicted toxin-antitoxin system
VKIKLDENMPMDLGELLRKADHDVVTVAEEGLAGCDDPPMLQAATAEARILMTYDTDFADIRRYPPGTHAGIVVFRSPWRMRNAWRSMKPSSLVSRHSAST